MWNRSDPGMVVEAQCTQSHKTLLPSCWFNLYRNMKNQGSPDNEKIMDMFCIFRHAGSNWTKPNWITQDTQPQFVPLHWEPKDRSWTRYMFCIHIYILLMVQLIVSFLWAYQVCSVHRTFSVYREEMFSKKVTLVKTKFNLSLGLSSEEPCTFKLSLCIKSWQNGKHKQTNSYLD